ncbi:uncharacterized protein RSE6_06684 [Rhynchosporium secalis]|uniref:Uncharacterized protein n=1 Tax=Rhynchosporium secalis TaxID=38038 RepID=A0A1E1MBY4_RHYSE|nr:uncharacterized protein RSE6_06684 [Rhynchosporium secalis]
MIPAGHVAILLARLHDSRWMGPPNTAPRASVDILCHKAKLRNEKRFADQVLDSLKKSSTLLILQPDYSDLRFKDVMGGLHLFYEQEQDQISINIQQFLAEYLVGFDDSTPFNIVNFLRDIPVKNWKKFCNQLSPYQLDAFPRLDIIQHGILWFVGCVALAKTLFAILIMLVAIADEERTDAEGDKIRNTFAAPRSEKKIFRVHSITGVKAALIAHDIPHDFSGNVDINQLASEFLVESALNDAAYDAMLDHLNNPYYDYREFAQFKTHLKTLENMPHEFTSKADLNERG